MSNSWTVRAQSSLEQYSSDVSSAISAYGSGNKEEESTDLKKAAKDFSNACYDTAESGGGSAEQKEETSRSLMGSGIAGFKSAAGSATDPGQKQFYEKAAHDASADERETLSNPSAFLSSGGGAGGNPAYMDADSNSVSNTAMAE